MSGASGVISNLNSALNCSPNCSCCQTLDSKINGLSAEIVSLKNGLSSLDSKQQSLEQYVLGELRKITDSIGAGLASLDRKIDAAQAFLLTSLAALRDFLLGQSSEQNSSLERRVSALEDRMNKRGLEAQDLAAKLSALAGRVTSLESWQSSIESRIRSIESAIGSWDSRLKALENQIEGIKNKIDAVERSIDSKFSQVKSEISEVSRELKGLIEDLKRLLSDRIGALGTTINSIAERLDRELNDIRGFIQSELSKLTTLLYDRIRALTDLIYSLLGGKQPEQDFKYLERRVIILERLVDSINSRTSNLPDSIKALQSKVETLEEAVRGILERLRDLANNNTNMQEIRGLFRQVSDKIDKLGQTDSNYNVSSRLETLLNLSIRNIQDTGKVLDKLSVNISGETILSDCKNGSDNINQSYSGTGLNALSSQIKSLSLALSSKLCKLQTNEDPTAQKQRDKTLNRIYNILGGDTWVDSAEQIRIYHDPEGQLRAAGAKQYNSKGETSKNTESNSLIDLIQNMLAPQYYRAGYQELPGEVPDSLLSIGSDKDRKILNALDLQQWLIEQLDALVGQFPLEIEIKDTDPLKPGDQSKKLELGNLSEVLAELMGLSFMQTQNSDILINYINRLGVETIATKNAVIITQDYAKANASYLGYAANPVKREVPYALNPAGDSLETILADVKGDLIGWANTDKNSVADYLKRIFFTVGIMKESNFIRPKNVDRLVDSLNMVRTQETEEASAKLNSDIATINDPNSTFNSARRQDTSLPEVLVKIKKKR